MKKHSLLLIIALACIPSLCLAAPIFAPPNTHIQTLHSEQTGRDYQILVLLPGSYQANSAKRYPTIYLTDAQWDFALVSSICDKLSYDKSIPEVILVGISYAGENPNYPDLRERDLTPSNVPATNPHSGAAPQFLAFLEDTLIPNIETNYPADPHSRVLGGTSYGGLFSLYALYQKPNLFRRHIANSPAVTWDDNLIRHQQKAFAKTKLTQPTRLALTIGQNEEPSYLNPVIDFQLQLKEHDFPNLKLLEWVAPDARHAGASIAGWTRGLIWTLSDLAPQPTHAP